MPTATHATVIINSIHVIDSSVTTTAEPGSSAEWYMTFVVNGQSAQWSHDSVKDDTVYPVNRQFVNLPLAPNGMITIQVSGYEHDTTSANDTLPTLTKTLHPAQDYQLGGTDWAPSPVSPEGSYSIEFTVIPAQGSPLTVAREYLAIYRPGSGGHALWSGNWKSFTKKWDELSKAGLRLTRLACFPGDTGVLTFGDSTERYFTGVFAPGGDGHALWVSEWPSFEAKWKELSAQGLRLVDLACYGDGNRRMFAGVFRAGTDRYALWISEWPSFEQKWKEFTSDGLRLVALDTYRVGGKRLFAGVYRAGNYGHALWVGSDWKGFKAKSAQLALDGLHLVDVATYADGGNASARFAGVFRASGQPSTMKRTTSSEFGTQWASVTSSGQRLAALDTFIDGSEE